MRRLSITLALTLSIFASVAQPALAEPSEPKGPWTNSPTLLCILGYHLPQHPVFGWYMDRCVLDGRGPGH